MQTVGQTTNKLSNSQKWLSICVFGRSLAVIVSRVTASKPRSASQNEHLFTSNPDQSAVANKIFYAGLICHVKVRTLAAATGNGGLRWGWWQKAEHRAHCQKSPPKNSTSSYNKNPNVKKKSHKHTHTHKQTHIQTQHTCNIRREIVMLEFMTKSNSPRGK